MESSEKSQQLINENSNKNRATSEIEKKEIEIMLDFINLSVFVNTDNKIKKNEHTSGKGKRNDQKIVYSNICVCYQKQRQKW